MQVQGKALRVTIYIGEGNRYQGKALHMALLEHLKREGAAGATVTRGLAGFGAKSRIHTASIVDLSTDLPIRIEWVDQPDVVERLLPTVRAMVDNGLIICEPIDVVQYAAGRRPDPLAVPVADVMRRGAVSVRPDTPIAEVISLLLEKGLRSLSVIDGDGRPIGVITDGDLLRRTELAARVALQDAFSPADWQRQVAELRRSSQTAEDVMTRPVVAIRSDAPLKQATDLMVGRDLKRLPVVDGAGRLVGWVSRIDILRALEYHQLNGETEETSPDGTTIAELVYRDAPTVPPDASLEEVVTVLERDRKRRAVVVDSNRRVLGIITDGDLLRRTRRETHGGLAARLRGLMTGRREPEATDLTQATEKAADLMSAPAITIPVDATPEAALRLMMAHGVKRLPVVDEEGRLVGLLGRASLLRGLLSADESR